MSRVNLPSEERIKSIDSTTSLATTFENTDVVVDSTLGRMLESNGTTFTKLFDRTSIKRVTNPDIADYEASDVVFDTSSDSIKYKAGANDTEWTRIQSKNHISQVDISSADPEDFEPQDYVIDNSGDIYKVTAPGGVFEFTPWVLRAAIELEADSSSAVITPYRAGDVILSSDLKLLKKEASGSVDWTVLKDLDKAEYVAPKFSVIGTRTGTDANGNVGTGDRSLFERSRGINHYDASAAIANLDDLSTYKEVNVIDQPVEINWNNARGIGVNRWQDVVGRLVFPSATIYNRTKDSAHTVSIVTFPTAQYNFAYEFTDSNNVVKYVRTSDADGIFSRDVVVNSDDSNKPIVRVNNAMYNTVEFQSSATLYPTESDAEASSNALTLDFIVVNQGTKAFATTGQAYTDPGIDTVAVTDTTLGAQKAAKNIIARLDFDDGDTALGNSFTVGYRQKAIVHVVDADEADQWGFNVADNDGNSEFDRNGTIILVSIESI